MSLEFTTGALRFVHVWTSVILFGAFAFGLYARAHVVSRRAEFTLACVGLISGVLWIAAMAHAIGGDALRTQPELIETIFFKTSFGPAWLAHLALGALAVGGSMFGASRRAHLGLAIMTLLLVSFAWIGHNATAEGWDAVLLQSAHAVHLLGAGIWVGGAYALFLRIRELDDVADAQDVLRRFSQVGYGAVMLLGLAGFVNLRLIAHAWLPDVGTAYGRLMALKLVLVVGVFCVAAFNRLYASAPALRSLLYRTIIAEHICFFAILAIAASLSSQSPHG